MAAAATSIRAGLVFRVGGEQKFLSTASPSEQSGPNCPKLSFLSSSRSGGHDALLSSARLPQRRQQVRKHPGCRALLGGMGVAARDGEDFEEAVEDTGLFLAGNASSTRRGVVGAGLALGFSAGISAFSMPALAADQDYKLYESSVDKFSILVPQEWSQGEGTVGQRKVTAFFPEKESDSANVNIVITDLGADYTSLGSFGTVDAFAENLVNSMDRAWKKPKGQAAKLVDSRAKNGMYYVEYTIQKPGEEKRHLLSVLGIAHNGWINRLYTVTGQFWENDNEKYKSSLQKAIASFRLA